MIWVPMFLVMGVNALWLKLEFSLKVKSFQRSTFDKAIDGLIYKTSSFFDISLFFSMFSIYGEMDVVKGGSPFVCHIFPSPY